MTRPQSRAKARRWLTPSQRDHAWIFAAALAIRCLYVASIADSPSFAHLQTEPKHYAEWASLIVSGHAPSAPFEQAPGFAYFCAFVSSLLGSSVSALAYVQAGLGALTCVAIAKIAGDLRGRNARRVAGGLAAAYGPFVYFTGEVLPETLFVCVCTAAVAISMRAREPDVACGVQRSWWVAGALWALAFLIRVNVLLALPFIAYDSWKRGGRRAVLRVLAPLMVVWGALVCTNAVHSHKLVLTVTSGGENLWLGNNAFADGVNPFPPEEAHATLESVMTSSTGTVDSDARMRSLAVDFIVRHPSKAFQLAWKKLVWTWNARELPNAADVEWQASRSWMFRGSPVAPLGFGIVLPLAVASLFVSRGLARRMPLLAGLVAIGVGSSVIFFTNGRFRIIVVPALLVMASIALTADWKAWMRERSASWRLVVAGAVAAGTWVAWGDFYGVSKYWLPELAVNTGIWQREDGHVDEAVASFRSALAAHPSDDIARINLAVTLEQQGKLDDALQTYVVWLREAPDDLTVRKAAEAFIGRHSREIVTLMKAPLGQGR